jgi:hypothetical protein
MLDTGAGSDPGALKSLPNRNPAIGEESFQDTSFPSGPTSANHPANQPGLLSTAPPPPQFHQAQESMQDSGQMPRNMLVGMTIAIILPPAMVIGMILGYLLASRV